MRARARWRRWPPRAGRCRSAARRAPSTSSRGGRSIVTDDTTEALVLNPANLAWLPAPELRFDWVGCPNDLRKVGCGESLGVATPLFLGLSTSLRLELVSPPSGDSGSSGTGFPYAGYQYAWLSWGLAAHLGEHAVLRHVVRSLVLERLLPRLAQRAHRRAVVPAQHALRVLGHRTQLQPPEPGAHPAAGRGAGARRAVRIRHGAAAHRAARVRARSRGPVLAGRGPVDRSAGPSASTCPASVAPSGRWSSRTWATTRTARSSARRGSSCTGAG